MRLIILGATGSLGGHVLRQALDNRHDTSVFLRDPAKLPAKTRQQVSVHTGDLSVDLPPDIIDGQDALISCAGHVSEGERFVRLVERIISAVETLPASGRPVCWFLAGAALLDIDASGRRAVELPRVKSTYWPHDANFTRLKRSDIAWRLLCPGPMVDQQALGLDRLRISLDRLPATMPTFAGALPGALVLPIFAALIPQMIVPYADAAAVMLANLDRDSAMARRRVGLALPVGMRGRKPR